MLKNVKMFEMLNFSEGGCIIDPEKYCMVDIKGSKVVSATLHRNINNEQDFIHNRVWYGVGVVSGIFVVFNNKRLCKIHADDFYQSGKLLNPEQVRYVIENPQIITLVDSFTLLKALVSI